MKDFKSYSQNAPKPDGSAENNSNFGGGVNNPNGGANNGGTNAKSSGVNCGNSGNTYNPNGANGSSHSNNPNGGSGGNCAEVNSAVEMAKVLSRAMNGKSEGQILNTIIAEAERGKREGTLTNADLDNFYNMLYPLLDGFKRKKLKEVITKLKSI